MRLGAKSNLSEDTIRDFEIGRRRGGEAASGTADRCPPGTRRDVARYAGRRANPRSGKLAEAQGTDGALLEVRQKLMRLAKAMLTTLTKVVTAMKPTIHTQVGTAAKAEVR